MNRKIFSKLLKAILINLITGLFASFCFLLSYRFDFPFAGLFLNSIGIFPWCISIFLILGCSLKGSLGDMLIFFILLVISIIFLIVITYPLPVLALSVEKILEIFCSNSEVNEVLTIFILSGFASAIALMILNLFFFEFKLLALVVFLSFLIGFVSCFLSTKLFDAYLELIQPSYLYIDFNLKCFFLIFPIWQILIGVLLVCFVKEEESSIIRTHE